MEKGEPARQEGVEQCPGEIMRKILGELEPRRERERSKKKTWGCTEAGAVAGSAGSRELGSVALECGSVRAVGMRVLLITVF